MDRLDDGSLAWVVALGRAVSDRWTVCGRTVGTLPKVATSCLVDATIPEVSAADLLVSAAASDLPVQDDADSFGQPPLVLYDEGDFFIQVLTWMDGTTSIHEHGFAGAFRVVQGSSLHIEHRFDMKETLAGGSIICGDLSQITPEVLRQGATRSIEPGGSFIHALFHLERPSVTVVVRNRSARLGHPQYNYRMPGLGWDGLWSDRTWQRRLRGLESAARLDPPAAHAALRRIAQAAPLWEAFWMIDAWSARVGWGWDLEELVGELAKRASPLAFLGSMYARNDHVRKVLGRRGLLSAPHLRLLLALLANLTEDADVTAVLRQLHPSSKPIDLLLDWVAELSAPAMRSVSGLRLTPERLTELRQIGGADTLLDDVRRAWGDPRSISDLVI